MADYGITGYGVYIPRLRLDRQAIAAAHKWMAPSLKSLAKGERAFASWDEDAITMAVEAGRAALGAASRGNVKALTLASTTFPYADLSNSGIAIGALALNPETRGADIGGSQRAGIGGLAQVLQPQHEQLFIASDRPRAKPASTQEMIYGAGAAAFLLGSENVIARLAGSASITTQFVDHFRAASHDYDYFWEERWIRDEGYSKLIPHAVKTALASAGLTISEISTFICAAPLKGAAPLIAKKLGFTGKISDAPDESVGYTGIAQPLLMLAGALEAAKPGDRILVTAFGQGADAIVLEVTDAITTYRPSRGLAAAISDKVATYDYMRMLSFYEEINLEWGMRAEKASKVALTTLNRESDQLSAFVAGKCGTCGTVQFPQLAYCVNPDCNAPASGFTAHPLTEEPAKVLTFTADWLSYHPAPPLYVGFVQFAAGARLLMEMVDIGPQGIEIGTPLKIVYRIKEPDKTRGFNRYFWKAAPIAEGA